MILLIEAFPSRSESNFDFLFSRLQDLGDDAFKWAVLRIVDTVPKLYPDDNLIAILREKANFFEILKRDGTPLITEERWDAPPEEWLRLKEKLRLK